MPEMSTPSTDELGTRLSQLAPAVDVAAGRELFERERSGRAVANGAPRWWLAAAALALVVAGVVGLWAMSRDDGDSVPVDQPTTDTAAFVGPATEGNGYETVLVAETASVFGRAELAVTDEEYASAWSTLGTGDPAPDVDLDRSAVLVITRPDNACADTIVRFGIEPGVDTGRVWTPVFEDLSRDCNDPLLSWVYVVALDRSALGSAATIRVPGAESYDVAEELLTYRADGRAVTGDTEPDEFRVSATGITVPLPPVGEPALHSTSVGLVWVVAHDDGSVSVLPGTVPQPPDEDEGGVTRLHSLVRASASGRTFAASGMLWDDHGRAISGGRANDLVGFAGRIEVDSDASEVEILESGATRIEGDPGSPVDDEDYPEPQLPPLIDLPTFMTLSSSGPIWRHLDATLVVENGVGRICRVPTDVPVPDLVRCDEAEFVLDTRVTSTEPDITTWFHTPILAFQDPLRTFTAVVPLGGRSSRNEAAFEEPPVTVTGSRFECVDAAEWLLRVDLVFAAPGSAELVIVDDGTELDSVVAQGEGTFVVGIALSAPPGPDARLLVSSGSSDVELELPPFDLDCS